jgi:hypothetical protein
MSEHNPHKLSVRGFGIEASATGWGIAALLLLGAGVAGARAAGWW